MKPMGWSIVKRTAAVLIALAAAVSLTSSRSTAPRYHYEVRRDLSVYFRNADSVIESVRGCLKRRREEIVIEYSSKSDNMEDIDELVSELMYYSQSETAAPDEGDYIACQLGGYSVDFTRNGTAGAYSYEITIRPDYYTDREQEWAVSDRVSDVISGLELDDGASDLDKVRAVHDWLCDNVEYDEIHKRNEHYHLRSTAYGALVYRHATCQGYAVSAYRLLRELGVDCRVVKGMAYRDDSDGEYHAWNIVGIDGKYYNMDVTWDDRLECTDYFLKSDAELSSHHRDEAYSSAEFTSRYPMADKGIG